jgi:membrane protein implicated in regulation of membrane protease activity
MLLLGGILLAIFVLPSPWGLVAVAAGGIVDTAETLVLLRLSRRRRALTGAEALVGATAVVVEPFLPVGQVRIRGELWRARCDDGARVGDEVVVTAVEGLTLWVALRPTRTR